MTVNAPATTFGDRLERAMYEALITLEELAKEAQVGRATIHRFLHDDAQRPTKFKRDTLIALARTLNVNGWWLLTGEGDMQHGDYRSSDHES